MGITAVLFFGLFSALRHQRSLCDEYRYRLPMAPDILLASATKAWGNNIIFIALTGKGYYAESLIQSAACSRAEPLRASLDQLVSATRALHPRRCFTLPRWGMSLLSTGESRYPAASPDGHWLAYSVLTDGNWNLFIGDPTTGESRRITRAPCNQIEPSWQGDSKTLLYASDCGRALWFTAIVRRQILP